MSQGTPHYQALRVALHKAGIDADVKTTQPLSGGCIHEVLRLTLTDGSSIVAKINGASRANLFWEESQGLEALGRTNTVLVPAPIGVTVAHDKAIFLMEVIEHDRPTIETWERFGEELGALHVAQPSVDKPDHRYGFRLDNHLGTTSQPNSWCDDWVEFNAKHRLGHQVALARNAGLLKPDEIKAIERVIERLDRLIPRSPNPALIHGDLWSGNALPARDRSGNLRVAVIDPAPYIGDGWADIAMMRLFGGFPNECFKRYGAIITDHESVPSRIAIYQLYHVLNHVNIFGRGYVAQAMSIARSLA